MNRKSASRKKASTARKPQAMATKAAKTPPVQLAPDASEYVSKLASALAEVSSAQNKWLQEVETASHKPALLTNPEYRARLSAALTAVGQSASGLRIQPVPDGMEAADELLGRAQAQAEKAVAGAHGADGLNTGGIVSSIQHLDEMSQLLQQAYRLIRG